MEIDNFDNSDFDTWGSDFEDVEEENDKKIRNDDIYEIPNGNCSQLSTKDVILSNNTENITPSPQPKIYIENVLLPTRKDEESKNFIETLKRKLNQKNFGKVSTVDPKLDLCRGHQKNDCSLTIKECIQKYPWFYKVDRRKAELILENYQTDGAFLIREHSGKGGEHVPFTLTLRYAERIFHIQIRIRQDQKFALGTEKSNEMYFNTVQEMIDTYKKTNLQLHSNGRYFGETKLTSPPIVYTFSK